MPDALALPGTHGSCLVIRCRSRTPASTVELDDWLQGRVAELREEEPRLRVRLTVVAADLSAASGDDGWLIEAELPAEQPTDLLASLAAPFEEILRNLRILGLDPRVLAPVSVPPANSWTTPAPSPWTAPSS